MACEPPTSLAAPAWVTTEPERTTLRAVAPLHLGEAAKLLRAAVGGLVELEGVAGLLRGLARGPDLQPGRARHALHRQPGALRLAVPLEREAGEDDARRRRRPETPTRAPTWFAAGSQTFTVAQAWETCSSSAAAWPTTASASAAQSARGTMIRVTRVLIGAAAPNLKRSAARPFHACRTVRTGVMDRPPGRSTDMEAGRRARRSPGGPPLAVPAEARRSPSLYERCFTRVYGVRGLAAARPLRRRGRDRPGLRARLPQALELPPGARQRRGLAVRDRPQRRARRAAPAQAPRHARRRARGPHAARPRRRAPSSRSGATSCAPRSPPSTPASATSWRSSSPAGSPTPRSPACSAPPSPTPAPGCTEPSRS